MEVDEVWSLYASMPGRLDRTRHSSGHRLTLTGKIRVTPLHTMTREVLAPGDTQAKPGKDNG